MELELRKKWLIYGLCLLCGLLLPTGCGHSSAKTIRIKALIDGADTVKIQGNKIWYEHESFDLPGKWQGQDQPTTINGQAWRPEWNDKTSVAYGNLSPAFNPRSPADVKLTKITGRGEVRITQLPSAENNQTLAVHFDDPESGADWYEVTIEWK